MIAVFCKNENYFVELGATPKKMFIRIKDINDVRGRSFTGVIYIYGWHDNNKICDAYNELKRRQPELFEN